MVALGFLSLLANVSSTPRYLPPDFAHVQGCHGNQYYDGKRMQESQDCERQLRAAKEALESTVSFGKDSGSSANSHVKLKDYKCPELEKSLGKELFAETAAAWIGRSLDCDGEYLTAVRHGDGMGQAVKNAFRRIGLAATHKVRRVHDELAFNHGDGPGRKPWTNAGDSDAMVAEIMFRLSHAQVCESVLLSACPNLKRKELRGHEDELGKSPQTFWSIRAPRAGWDETCDGKDCNWQSMMQVYQTHYWYARALHPLPYPKGFEPGAMNVAVHVRLGDRTEWADMMVPKNNLEMSIQYINDVVIPSHDSLEVKDKPVTIHVFTESPRTPAFAVDGPHKLETKLLNMVRFPEHVPVKWHVDEDDFVAWNAFAAADIAVVQLSSTFGTTARNFLPSQASTITFGGVPQKRVRCTRSCFDPQPAAKSPELNSCLKKCLTLKA
eukprot:TRINITY_DN5046_c0_g1_i1.p1 TRINITY_DN5046_c0_g1~~TRINITY_DN5046_c0_g1_i1.p1  ORF type:complete len:448 (-),score=75.27 TRINITY_DN5046_c0_g1_i1:30-1346(-)